jgi:enterochelin esterase-like enzyme
LLYLAVMALTPVDEPLGPPWGRQLGGAVDRYVVDSAVLAGNPLGDPARRPLYVYRAPGIERRSDDPEPFAYDVPVIVVLQAYLNQADRWFNRETFEPTMFERLDTLFSGGAVDPAVVVFADAWTSLGGAQFINSPGVGRYSDYICDEVVPFVEREYPVAREARGRGVAGHSSGGYGAAINAMLRPDVFGAFSSRAGDALFGVSMQPEFPQAAKILRDAFDGSIDRFVAAFTARESFDYGRFGVVLMLYAAAASYSPGLDGRPELPFDPRTGATIPGVFERWLGWDPVELAADRVEALRGMRRIHLEAGRGDEANLDLANQAFSDELTRLKVPHSFELFDGGHGGTGHRLPGQIAALVEALGAG